MLSASLACLAAPLLPEPDGEYAVGMRRFELTDETRRGVMANDPSEPRVIPANVVRLRLEGIRHMGYTDLILLMDGPEHAARFGTIEPRLAVDTVANVSLAFLNRYLKQGNPMALEEIVRRTPALRPHSPDSVREWALSRQ